LSRKKLKNFNEKPKNRKRRFPATGSAKKGDPEAQIGRVRRTPPFIFTERQKKGKKRGSDSHFRKIMTTVNQGARA
jgi:hypothetical protein